MIFIDRLRMYENVGAACGRIHPTGMGKYTFFLMLNNYFFLFIYLFFYDFIFACPLQLAPAASIE